LRAINIGHSFDPIFLRAFVRLSNGQLDATKTVTRGALCAFFQCASASDAGV
jgi:hypothetical protein